MTAFDRNAETAKKLFAADGRLYHPVVAEKEIEATTQPLGAVGG
jgi:hypothetical protein